MAKSSTKKKKLQEITPNSEEIISSHSYLTIPTDIFRRYPLAVLESIVIYLKDERNLNFHEIGVLLGRDERNMWTVYHRAKKKLDDETKE